MRFQRPNLCLAAILLLASVAVHAAPLRMVADKWPPYVDESLPGRGLAIELVASVLNRAGYETQFNLQDWSRALEGARIGVYDVVANIWYTEDRGRDLDYSDPYLTNDLRFLKRKESDIHFARFDDLRGMVIGVIKDYAYPKAFSDSKKLIKVANNSLLPALSELVKGRYDLVIGDQREIDFMLKKFLPNDSKNLEYLTQSVGRNPLYMAVSKTNPQHQKIVGDFNRALRAMKKDGSYQRILDAHLSDP